MDAHMLVSRSVPSTRSWALLVVVALAPVWLIGILDRGLWTPDEPREADIAWRMSQQSDRALPQLAATPFLEKPPLSYWSSGKLLGLNVTGMSTACAAPARLIVAKHAAKPKTDLQRIRQSSTFDPIKISVRPTPHTDPPRLETVHPSVNECIA